MAEILREALERQPHAALFTACFHHHWHRKQHWHTHPEARAISLADPTELEKLPAGWSGDESFTKVFHLTPGEEGYDIPLRTGACRSVFGERIREARRLAVPRSGVPIRVILNGRFDWTHDWLYGVADYYLFLRTAPNDWSKLKTIDRQEDLF